MSYPASINSITSKTDGPSHIIYAAHLNAIRTALLDLVTAIGGAPQGNKTSLEDRLDVRIDDDGKLKYPTQFITVGKSNADYSSITAALASISDSAANKIYTIFVFPGIYSEGFTLKNYVNIVASDRYSVIVTDSVTDNGAEVNCILSFCITSTSKVSLSLSHANSNISFFGNLSSTSIFTINISNGTLIVYGDVSCTTPLRSVNISGGVCTIFGNINSTGSNCVNSSGGLLTVSGTISLVGGTSSACYIDGGTVYIIGDVNCDCDASISLISGSLRVRDSRIVCTYDNANGHTISHTAGTLVLQNSILVCTHVDSKSIYTAGAVDCVGMSSYSNRAVSAGVTQKIALGFTFDADVI